MKKEEEKINLEELLAKTKIEKVDTVGELKRSFISYAMAVNVSRAIPDVRDGLKPVHRRILYSMGEMGNTHDKPFRKCARIVGEVMGKYHPHGDSSVYDALVRLAQDFSIRCPLVDGHGNFGSVDGDPPAAYRYTEARLSKIANLMIEDIDKETVDMTPNFDETLLQPVVLPSKIPNLLVNGSDGIAVGMATNIPPHNLTEVINGVQAYIDNPDIDIDELIDYIPAPDFPTGGIIMGRSAVKHAYTTGRGGIIVRGRAEIEEGSNGRQKIVITELPYQVNKAKFIISIAELVKNKKIEGIADLREESDRQGMRIVVDVKKDANAQVVLNKLYKHTELQQNFGIIMLALVNGTPKVLNLKEIIAHYVAHQQDVVVRRTKFDLRKTEEREHIVQGLVIALANIDEVIKIIKTSADRADAINKLKTNFNLDEIQANAIMEMKLSRLTSLETEKLNEELRELYRRIADFKDILERPARVLKIVRDGLEEIKINNYDPRKTEISMEMGGIDIEDLIPKEDVLISMTRMGYIKRMSTNEYHSQKRGGVGVSAQKIKEEDVIDKMFVTFSHNDLLFFTTKGKVYVIKAYEIPECQRQSKGRAVVNLIPLDADEKVSAIIPREKGQEGNLILATKNGLVKKTSLKEFESIKKAGKIAISLLEDDELVEAKIAKEDDEVLFVSSKGKCIRFKAENIRNTGRKSVGVKSMKIGDDDKIVSMEVIKPGVEILTITENGYGKRTNESEYRVQGRAGSGIKAGAFNDKTGDVVALRQIEADKDIMLIADNGLVIRTPIDAINILSRAAQGVRIMKLRANTKIVGIAFVDKEEETEEETNVEPQEAQVAETTEE